MPSNGSEGKTDNPALFSQLNLHLKMPRALYKARGIINDKDQYFFNGKILSVKDIFIYNT